MSNIGVWKDAEPGVRRKILSVGKEMMTMIVEFAEGAEGYEHAHPHEQITFCVKGRFAFYLNGVRHDLSAGEALHIPGGVKHRVEALEAGQLYDSFTPVREDLLAD